MHTQTYAELCARLGGFVHHRPEAPDPSRYDQDVIDRTTAVIQEAGYSVEGDLWGQPDGELVSVAASCQHSDDSGPIVTMPKPKGQPAELPTRGLPSWSGSAPNTPTLWPP